MADLPNPHDAFFRETLSRVEAARDFVAHYLPAEVVACFDLGTLRVAKDSFVDEDLRSHYSDLLYEVGLRGGGDALVYLLVEHKSHPEPDAGLDLLRYTVKAWGLLRKQGRGFPLPPVVAVLFYHGREPWRVSAAFEDLIAAPPELQRYVPRFRYELCDLSRYSDEELKGGVRLRAALLLWKHIFDDAPEERLLDALKLLLDALGAETGLRSLESYLRYIIQATDRVAADDLKRVLDSAKPGLGGAIMPTLAEQWMEQGKQKGRQEGMLEGARGM